MMCPMSDTNPEGQNIPAWTLGWRMKRALAHGGVGVEEMAANLGYERKALSRWMSDKGTPPRPANLKQWALKCRVSYEWLDSGGGPGPNTPPGQDESQSRWKSHSPTVLALIAA